MKKEDKIIMYDSPEAANEVTVTGWVSSDGKFWGKDERAARYNGCTHQKCECGNIMERYYTICKDCRKKARDKRFMEMPVVQWNGGDPICLFEGDKFFFEEDEFFEYCHEENIQPEDLQLTDCRPQYLQTIDSSHWEDVLCEDQEIPIELEKRLKDLNKFIQAQKPISWVQGKNRVIVTNESYKKWLE